MTCMPESRGNASENHQPWCRVDQVDSRTVVSAGGRFDTHQYSKLDDALTVAGHMSNRLVVDLTQVESMKPAAFGMLIGSLQRLRHHDQTQLCLVAPTDMVARAMDLTVLERQFSCYTTVGDAIAALA